MKNSVQFLRFKKEYPIAMARLRLDFKAELWSSIVNWMKYREVDGDLIIDSPKLPEPIVLRAGSKHWTWLSSENIDEQHEHVVI